MINKFKKILIRFIPKSVLLKYRKNRSKKNLNKLYDFDKKRYTKYAYELNDDYTLNNLKSKITFHYHSIEKGLSHPNLRLGFGKYAFTGLFFAMDKFLEKGYTTSDNRFQQAISVIKSYIDVHKKKGFSVEWVEKKYSEYEKYLIDEFKDVGGADTIELDEIPDYSKLNFKKLALNRYSIRDFGEKNVKDSDIYEAIQIATKTPSVCNRQAYKVYQIKNPDLFKKTYILQGGLTTHGDNLQQLLLVTSNREFMNGPNERNQTYIDGGMFLMSLVYALTYKQIATCTLNTNFSLQKEKLIRDLLGISYSEDIIAFIAVGSFAQSTKYSKSPRDSWEDITVIVE